MKKILLIIIFFSSALEARWPLKELGMSLLVPGLGQLITGQKGKAMMFGAIEFTAWTGFGLFRLHGNSLTEDYRIYGMGHAGADPGRRDEEYWKAVELFFSREAYLEYLRRVARGIYPDDIEAQKEYVESHAVSGEWQWKSVDEWFSFQDLIKGSRIAYTRSRLMILAAVANRIASLFDILLYYKFGSRDVGFLKDVRLRSSMITKKKAFLGITARF